MDMSDCGHVDGSGQGGGVRADIQDGYESCREYW